jgi:hypothetical protein
VLNVGKSNENAVLSWTTIAAATQYDIVHGDLGLLSSGSGDFSVATIGCLDDNRTTTSVLFPNTPPPGGGYWFLVGGANCGGRGSYDSGGAAQVGLRDAEIAASLNDCL